MVPSEGMTFPRFGFCGDTAGIGVKEFALYVFQ